MSHQFKAYNNHAKFYEQKLEEMGQQYRRGGEHVLKTLRNFDDNRPQIELAFQRLSDIQAPDEPQSHLRINYCTVATNVLLIRLLPTDYLRWLEQALADVRRLPSATPEIEAILLHTYGRLHLDMGHYDRSQASLDRGLVITRKHNLKSLEALFKEELERLALNQGKLSAVVDAPITTEQLSLDDLGRLLNHAQKLVLKERFMDALDTVEPLLGQAREKNNQVYSAHILHVMGNISNHLEDYDTALAYGQEVLSIGKLLSHKELIGNGMSVISNSYLSRKRYDEAMPFLRERITMAVQLGDQSAIAKAQFNMGAAYTGKREFAEARACYNEARAIFVRMGVEHEVRAVDRQRLRCWIMGSPPYRVVDFVMKPFDPIMGFFLDPLVKKMAKAWLNWRQQRSYK